MTVAAAVAIWLRKEPEPCARVFSRYKGQGFGFGEPVGYQRCYAVLQCGPSISNSGFAECFYYPDRDQFIAPCIGFFEKLGRKELVRIFEKAEASVNQYRVEFSEENDISQLDSRYYKAIEEQSISELVDEYWRRFPEDFRETD